MKITDNKKKNKIVTSLDLKPRDHNVLAMIGKSRTFADRKRKQKVDKVGRKAKHKGQF